jgi:hypothetical protein
MLKPSLWSMALLIVAAAATRIMPHWWNLTAIGAVCLFGGAYFQRKWAAFVVPLAALALSDVILQLTIYRGYPPTYFKYVCFAATVPLGFLLQGHTRAVPVLSMAVTSTLLFFLLSNFGVWLGGDGVRYPLTPAGLVACYVAAVPFAMNSLYGNLLFSGILFGGVELLKQRGLALQAAQPSAAHPAV